MKKTTKMSLVILGSMIALGQVHAQAVSRNDGSQERRASPSERQSESRSSESRENGESSAEREPTVNDILMASGNQLSESTIQQISQLQERKSLLDAQITTLQAERNYLDLQKQIRDLGGEESMSNVSIAGVHGTAGNLRSNVNYNDRMIEVSRGTIVANEWVVTDVTREAVKMLNMDDKSEMTVSRHGYSVVEYQADGSDDS